MTNAATASRVRSIDLFSTKNVTAHFATAISGIDAARAPDEKTAATLLKLLDTRGILIIRSQQLTPAQFIAFARGLGEIATDARNAFCSRELPQLTLHSNLVENGVPLGYNDAGRQWRMDGAHRKLPYRATLMYAAEVPRDNGHSFGDSEFADTATAFDTLALALRSQITGMRALHPHGAGRKWRTRPFFADSGMTRIFHGGEEHPVIRTHPHTGRKSLYVSRGSTAHISGMTEQDSEALLDQLYRHIERREFIYRHAWQTGDLLLWDNAFVQHRSANDYALPLRRLAYRTQLKGAPARTRLGYPIGKISA